jgi:hypothetical protein
LKTEISITEAEENFMKKIISAGVQRPRSLDATVVSAEFFDIIPRSPSKSRSSASSPANRSAPEPADPQPKPFFHRWLDTWRAKNGGDHGQSR